MHGLTVLSQDVNRKTSKMINWRTAAKLLKIDTVISFN